MTTRPAFVMGLGLGSFLDGIVLHEVLQWHHLLTGDAGGEPMTTVAGLEANTLADGLFHLATWLLVVVALGATQRGGAAASWRQRDRPDPLDRRGRGEPFRPVAPAASSRKGQVG